MPGGSGTGKGLHRTSDRFQNIKVGRLTIPAAGEYEVAVVPHPKDKQAVMNLRGLRLTGGNLSAEILAPRER